MESPCAAIEIFKSLTSFKLQIMYETCEKFFSADVILQSYCSDEIIFYMDHSVVIQYVQNSIELYI